MGTRQRAQGATLLLMKEKHKPTTAACRERMEEALKQSEAGAARVARAYEKIDEAIGEHCEQALRAEAPQQQGPASGGEHDDGQGGGESMDTGGNDNPSGAGMDAGAQDEDDSGERTGGGHEEEELAP